MMVQQDMLDAGKIEDLVTALRSIDTSSSELAEKIRIEAGYFETNTERMRYPEFRHQHLFVGSGVIEAGCKTVIAAPTPSWLCGAPSSTLALRTTGRLAGHDFHL